MRPLTRSSMRGTLLCVGLAGLIAALAAYPSAQQEPVDRRAQGFIGGTVESAEGREAGVWVIAETNDLDTKFVKIVVTADDGQFMLPELPNASYDVWVRGYGLVDSPKVQARPGATLALKAVIAPTPAAAAEVYPANYWYSLIEPPAASEFPGTGPEGNGISETMLSQAQWVDNMKQGCMLCHQLGNLPTRDLSHMDHLGFETSVEAWDYRVQTGMRGNQMTGRMGNFGRQRGLQMYADWTDRIAAGELPPTPPRPQGVERNLVVTMWDWGNEKTYAHDEITTAKTDPTVNAYGPVYAVDSGRGKVLIVDPLENTSSEVAIPTINDQKWMWRGYPTTLLKPSNYWGDELPWNEEGASDPHNPMMDTKGRLWLTSAVRRGPNPAWCLEGSTNKYAQYYPMERANRHASYYDPETGEFKLIDTCFGTHHLQFGEDPDETLYFSGAGDVIPWINTRMYDETGDGQASQGWCPTVVDTNGDGRITKPWNEPIGGGRSQDEGGGGGRVGKFDPTLDTRVNMGSYTVITSPTDGAVWAASTQYPSRVIRLERGNNPPETCRSEIYTPPDDERIFGSRGIDMDRNGVLWMSMSGSSGVASFDRSMCTVFGGPTVLDGKHCSQGWKYWPTEGPKLKGTEIPADFHYTGWVDQFNASGLGANTPIINGTNSDSLLALNPNTEEWVTLRVPYPMGFFQRGLDGRIDDPDAGWKGRGLWANYGTNFVWHIEGGKGTKSKMVNFQLRPDPLAR